MDLGHCLAENEAQKQPPAERGGTCRVSRSDLEQRAHSLVGLRGAARRLGNRANEDDNQKLYGHRLTAKEILVDGTVPSPRAAEGLDGTLTKYPPPGGRTFTRL